MINSTKPKTNPVTVWWMVRKVEPLNDSILIYQIILLLAALNDKIQVMIDLSTWYRSLEIFCACVWVCMRVWLCMQHRKGDSEFSPIVWNVWRISLPDGATEPGKDNFSFLGNTLLLWMKDPCWDLCMTGSPQPNARQLCNVYHRSLAKHLPINAIYKDCRIRYLSYHRMSMGREGQWDR